MNERRLLLIGIPVIATLAMLMRGVSELPMLPTLVVSWLISVVYTIIFWLSNRALWFALIRRFPNVEQTTQRLWRLALVSLAIGAVATLLLGEGLHWIFYQQHIRADQFWQELAMNMVPTLVVLLIYESRHFFEQWKTNLQRAEQLARAGTQAQLDALQSQLDPHFLFNNLNTLSALIEPGNAPAQQFVEQLADVYRYVLQAQGRATVSLAEELAFVETYLGLHKARFRQNLVVEMNVPPAALARQVAPLSIQLLVENALKHNVASGEHPLRLRLWADETADALLVENTLRPRTAGLAPGTGTGLENVRRRYALLGAAQPVEASSTAGLFTVRLPLLPATGAAA
ncbi:sensor histidine kinase [Hymenobacter arizonensis]|uniref:Histidine kinase n=1 Tax=Hymenobacter arizonensis TaxID=1227077 RepID=A0A1I5SJV8_HYMAR|nr:histidine kinase [Hymenobacter arizonensis]SFP70931.1 Histidine kinase [Hymenobacter arizonensis]